MNSNAYKRLLPISLCEDEGPGWKRGLNYGGGAFEGDRIPIVTWFLLGCCPKEDILGPYVVCQSSAVSVLGERDYLNSESLPDTKDIDKEKKIHCPPGWVQDIFLK